MPILPQRKSNENLGERSELDQDKLTDKSCQNSEEPLPQTCDVKTEPSNSDTQSDVEEAESFVENDVDWQLNENSDTKLNKEDDQRKDTESKAPPKVLKDIKRNEGGGGYE